MGARRLRSDASAVRTVSTRDLGNALGVIRALRGRAYDVALDFQGLIKSGLLAGLSGSKEVLGFRSDALREKLAAVFYGRQVAPEGAHVWR